MADISDEELFSNALEPTEPEVTEEVAEQAPPNDDRPRDEQGRFAPKQEVEAKTEAEPAAKVPAEQSKDEAHVPSWRLKEIREERDALRQQLAEFQRQIATQRPQPAPKPDLFEKPDEFVAQGVEAAVNPIKAEIEGIREFFSRERAVDKYGEEKVAEAFTALDRAAKSGDPLARMTVQAVKQSMHPFGDIVQWHLKNEISTNPDAVFQRMLEERLKDEKFKGELTSKLNPASAEKPKPVFQVPPSLSRAAAEQATLQEDGNIDSESLFRYALR